jgi:hypothetical protein
LISILIFLVSLLQSYPCIDHPYKNNDHTRTYTRVASGHGSVKGMHPPRCH